ncbi:MAG: hypothetical protein CMO01_20010 [Thalassobius sp.]|nr:hypothetical protein [Thalassovita sp.]
MDEVKLFESKQIRSILHNGQWYFSVVDVIAVLTDSNNPRNYWSTLKTREQKRTGIELSTICVQLKLPVPNGRKYATDCANQEALLRIIQSVPSPKAEPFRRWLARVGANVIDEKNNKRLAAHKKLKETQNRFFENIKDRGVGEEGFIRVLDAGDKALFGGADINEKYGIEEDESPDDYMNNLLLKGKDFATELSNHHVIKKDLQGEDAISKEHEEQNEAIRKHLTDQDIKPEELPAESNIKDIKKLKK